MNKEDIKNIIPHREAMLLVDEVSLTDSKKAVGKYTVKGDEWFLRGHYPDKPIVPGIILCEILAQTCCMLFKDALKNSLPLLVGMEKIKFKKSVLPKDTLETVCNIEKVKGNYYFASGQGFVNGELCVSGKFLFSLLKQNPQIPENNAD